MIVDFFITSGIDDCLSFVGFLNTSKFVLSVVCTHWWTGGI